MREMDSREMFDLSEGRLCFVPLDGNGSRVDYEFLKHANDPSHEWVVCTGVSCGTSLWQVGDSSEQNGSFNMEFSRAKADLVQLKNALCLNSKLAPAYSMLLINRAWEKIFSRATTNKKAMSGRG